LWRSVLTNRGCLPVRLRGSTGSSLCSIRPDTWTCARQLQPVEQLGGRSCTLCCDPLVGVLDEPRAATRGASGNGRFMARGLLTERATARMKGSHIPRVSGDEGVGGEGSGR
jgi:hypothetical protein